MSWMNVFRRHRVESNVREREEDREGKEAASRALRDARQKSVEQISKWHDVKKVTDDFAIAVERALRNPR